MQVLTVLRDVEKTELFVSFWNSSLAPSVGSILPVWIIRYVGLKTASRVWPHWTLHLTASLMIFFAPAAYGEAGRASLEANVNYFQNYLMDLYEIWLWLLFLLSVGLPVANSLDVPQPCGLLYYP
jgi:hypothetical protein